MKAKSYLIVLVWLYFIPNYGQSPPTVDENWNLNSNLSDEFNRTTLGNTLWLVKYCHGGCYSGCNMHPDHVDVDGNNLILTLDFYDDPHDGQTITELWSAGIETINFNYPYGYFEMRAILPGYYKNSQPCGEGLWPVFWTHYKQEDNAGCLTVLDEIDILEPDGYYYADANANSLGWHDELGNCDRYKPGNYKDYNLPILFEDYHKFAVEWLPERIIFYFDDEPVYSSYNDETVPNNPQQVHIMFQLGGHDTWPDPSAPYPLEYIVDYFRYYQLNMDNCNSDITFQNNDDLNNYAYGVRRNINIGTETSSISLISGDNITLRASGEFTINGDFTVPRGSELSLIPTPCY